MTILEYDSREIRKELYNKILECQELIRKKFYFAVASSQTIISNPSIPFVATTLSQKPALASVFAVTVALGAIGVSMDDDSDIFNGIQLSAQIPINNIVVDNVIEKSSEDNPNHVDESETFVGPPVVSEDSAPIEDGTITVDDDPTPIEDGTITVDDDPTPIEDGTITVDDTPAPVDDGTVFYDNIILVGNNPHSLTLDANTDKAYVVNLIDNSISIIDTNINSVIETIPIDHYPYDIAIDDTNNKAYVIHATDGEGVIGNTVSVIDTNTSEIIDTIEVGDNPREIIVDTENNQAYTVNDDSNTVSVIDTNTDQVIDTIPVGSDPRGVTMNENGKIYMANYGDDTISVIDTNRNNESYAIPVEDMPFRIAIDNVKVKAYVTHYDTDIVSVIGLNTNTVIDTIKIESGSLRNIAVDDISSKVYVVSASTSTVSVIDTDIDQVIDTIPVGGDPRDVILDGTYKAYVTNQLDNTVSVIDLQRYGVLSSDHLSMLPTPDWKPHGIVYSPLQEGQNESVVEIPPKNIHTDVAGLDKFTDTIKMYYPRHIAPVVNSAAESGMRVDVQITLDNDDYSYNREQIDSLVDDISDIQNNPQSTINSVILDLPNPSSETDGETDITTYDFTPLSDAIAYAKSVTPYSIGVAAPFESLKYNDQLYSAISNADSILVYHYPDTSNAESFGEDSLQNIPQYYKFLEEKFSDHDIYFEVASPSGDGGGINGIDGTEQAEFYQNIKELSEEEDIPVYVFEAFDESWKGNFGDNEHWGLFHENRTLKPELLSVFYDDPDNIPGGYVDAAIENNLNINTFDASSSQDVVTSDDDENIQEQEEETTMIVTPVANIDVLTDGPYNRGDTITFSAENSYHPAAENDSEKIDVYSWNFGDNSNDMGEIVEKTFRAPGEYEITLKVYDGDGNKGTDIVIVKIE